MNFQITFENRLTPKLSHPEVLYSLRKPQWKIASYILACAKIAKKLSRLHGVLTSTWGGCTLPLREPAALSVTSVRRISTPVITSAFTRSIRIQHWNRLGVPSAKNLSRYGMYTNVDKIVKLLMNNKN